MRQNENGSFVQITRCAEVFNFISRNNGKCGSKEILKHIHHYTNDEFEEMSKSNENKRYIADKKMLQRDIMFIRNKLNIIIEHNLSTRKFSVDVDSADSIGGQILNLHYLAHKLDVEKGANNNIIYEKRKPVGTEWLLVLNKAILGECLVSMLYHSFKSEFPESIEFFAYHLKEAKGRWYVVGVKNGSTIVKTYGLDRLSEVRILKSIKRNGFAEGYDIQKQFKDCFGAYNLPADPVKVVFLTSNFQAKYIKTYRIHESQKEIANGDYTLIELFIKLTPDFLMELMMYGDNIQILEPASLVSYMIGMHENAIKILKKKAMPVGKEFLI
jgi:hypothetical protein